LVGWQYNGHDSKYPAWFEANEKLKRAQDRTAIESLRWLMGEAKKYHTTVSVHINMFDAYEDSPLWEEYAKNNIVARSADGTLRAAEWGYPISYAQEWKTGFAQKRIDRICELLPLQQAGTVHIDAFHTWPPTPKLNANGEYDIDLSRNVTSPFLNFTVEDEAEAQRNIFRYWAAKGIDVTSETVDVLRASSFAGYQPMAWWFSGGLKNYLSWPAEFYCGGRDKSDWGKLFGTSMHGEAIVKNDFKALTGFKEEFCLRTAVWYYLNRLKRIYVIDGDIKVVQFSGNVRSTLSKDRYKITQDSATLLENDDVLIPALWINERSLIAYSKAGYQNKELILPPGWESVRSVKVEIVGVDGKSGFRTEKVVSGRLKLTVGKDEMLLVQRQ
ncbi:MAG TPA: endo-alpha-N-acetylgalactosaminidase family protein, partial [Puia sp.]|nr:endo-alpha-N-acetylgalactosaminidase family protein [Puia sp.]